ncbi:MAG: hypothetical protein U1E39_15060 [Planctomycetota bacterium]
MTDAVSRLLAGPVNPAWRSAAAALPPADLERLAEGIDALARLDAPSRAFAVEAYLGVPETLDPRRPGAVERWRFLFDRTGANPRLEAPLRRALELGLPPGELTWTAKAVLAQRLDVDGRGDEAEALLREVLVAARSSGTRVERGALANLVWMCLNRGREAEALVLARYTLGRMVAAGDAWGEAILLDQLAHLYGWGHAWDEVRKVVEALGDLEPRADPGWRAKVAVMRERHLARIAHASGAIDDALAALDRAEAGVERAVEPGVLRGIGRTRVRMLLDAGRVEEAGRRLADLTATPAGERVEEVVLHARVAVASAPPGPARRAVELALAMLALRGPGAASPGVRVRTATELAPSLRTRADLADLVVRVYDVAAGAVVERLAELETFVRDTPEVARPTASDLRLLDAMRVRFLSEHAELGRALVRLHAASGPGATDALARLHDAGTGFVCVCAWCQRVRTRDGGWLPVQQFLPLAPRGPFEVTHGMCDACYRSLDADAEGGAGRRG